MWPLWLGGPGLLACPEADTSPGPLKPWTPLFPVGVGRRQVEGVGVAGPSLEGCLWEGPERLLILA